MRDDVVAEGEGAEAREVQVVQVKPGHVAEVLVAVEGEAREGGGAGGEPGWDELVHEGVESVGGSFWFCAYEKLRQDLLWKLEIFLRIFFVVLGGDE